MVSSFLQTERLSLLPASTDYAAMHLELMNTPKWIENIGDRNVHTVAEAEEYIATKMLPQQRSLGFGNYFIQLEDTKDLIGCVGIYDRPGLEGYDFGFALLPQYEKQGYALEASQCLLKAARSIFRLKKLSAITIPSNVESQRLLEKLGFSFIRNTTVAEDPELLMLYQLDL